MKIRYIESSDYHKGVIELLAQLTTIEKSKISAKEFECWCDILKENNLHKTIVIEDDSRQKIIGIATIVIEMKLIHNMGRVGHIEDVVVDADCRGKGVGKHLIGYLTEYANLLGCYKVILDCADKNIAFYQKCGFKQNSVQMSLYLK